MQSVEEYTRTMFNWAERMQRRAALLSNVVTSCGQIFGPYPRRLEKVKFGIPVEDVCKNDIPGLLLVLILKLNKEGLYKKDIFRAPGHQGNIKKLVCFLQVGRLVNMDRFSVYTIASVLKKFLSKVPGGIFGVQGEQDLFRIIEWENAKEQRAAIHRLIVSLPECTQRLLVLIFGTLRLIATNSENYGTGMTSEALGVSVAPSFLQTCVADGREATMEDVERFKVATKIMQFIIDNFGTDNLFGRDNYEYYARITGRVLKVDNEWIFSVRYPPDRVLALCEDMRALKDQADARSCLTLIHVADAQSQASSASLAAVHEGTTTEPSARLSLSLEADGFYAGFAKCSLRAAAAAERIAAMEELRTMNRNTESTRSLSSLPEVHERQVERMRARSEWFLSPVVTPRHVTFAEDSGPTSAIVRRGFAIQDAAGIDYRLFQLLTNKGGSGLSGSSESVQRRPNIRRSNLRRFIRLQSQKDEPGDEKKESAEPGVKKTEPDFEKPERDVKKTEPDSEKPERDVKKTERDSDKPERDVKKTERDSDKPERDVKKTEPDFKKPERKVKKTEPDFEKPERDVKKTEPDFEKPERDVKKTEPDFEKPERDVKKTEPDSEKPERDVKKTESRSKSKQGKKTRLMVPEA